MKKADIEHIYAYGNEGLKIMATHLLITKPSNRRRMVIAAAVLVTMVLLCLSLPYAKQDITAFREAIQTFLLAIGAGLFGLLGFMIGGFALYSGKSFERLQDECEALQSKEQRAEGVLDTFERVLNHQSLLMLYKESVVWGIAGIIITFLLFVVTLIPSPFSPVLFMGLALFGITPFYGALFSTFALFSIGLSALLKETKEVVESIDEVLLKNAVDHHMSTIANQQTESSAESP